MRRLLGRQWYEEHLRLASPGKYWCPLHEDEGSSQPGFSLRVADDGTFRWHCFSCDLDGDAIDFWQRLRNFPSPLSALENLESRFGRDGSVRPTGSKSRMEAKPPKPPKPSKQPKRYTHGSRPRGVPSSARERRYEYEFDDESVAYRKLRWDWTDDEGERHKACAFVFPEEGHPDWWWWGRGGPAILYKLPLLEDRKLLLYAEGEKCVDALWDLTLPATTAGSSDDWQDRFADDLHAAGVECIGILPDNDDPGRKVSAAVAASCHARGIRVQIVELPGLGDGEDVVDWLARGKTREDLLEHVQGAPPWTPPMTHPAAKADSGLSRLEEALLYLADRTEPNALDGMGFSRDHANELMPLAERLRMDGTGSLTDEEARTVEGILRVYKRQLRAGGFRMNELRPGTEPPNLVPRSAPEIMSAEIPEPVVLWGGGKEPILVRGELSLLHAREGVGKSWFTLGLAVAIALGLRSFLDMPVQGARALVISTELSPWHEQQRLRLVLDGRQPPESLFILGRDAAGLDLSQPDHLKQLEVVLAEYSPALAILDPLAALWLSEELNLDFQTLTRNLAAIADEHGVAILLSHHEGKASSSSKDDDASAFRGGTALRAGVRTAIRLAEEPTTKGVRVAFTKSNLGRLPGDLFLVEGEPWKFVLGDAPPSPKEKAEATDTKVREFLEAHPNSTSEAVCAGAGINPSTLTRIFKHKKRARWLKRFEAEGQQGFLYYLEEDAE